MFASSVLGLLKAIFFPGSLGSSTPAHKKQYNHGLKNNKSNHQHSGPDFREVYTKRDEILKRRNGGNGWF